MLLSPTAARVSAFVVLGVVSLASRYNEQSFSGVTNVELPLRRYCTNACPPHLMLGQPYRTILSPLVSPLNSSTWVVGLGVQGVGGSELLHGRGFDPCVGQRGLRTDLIPLALVLLPAVRASPVQLVALSPHLVVSRRTGSRLSLQVFLSSSHASLVIHDV